MAHCTSGMAESCRGFDLALLTAEHASSKSSGMPPASPDGCASAFLRIFRRSALTVDRCETRSVLFCPMPIVLSWLTNTTGKGGQNRSPKRRLHVRTELASGPTGGRGSSNASGLCPTGAIACRRRSRAGLGAIDFAAHRRVMKVQLPGDRPATELGRQQGLDRHAIRWCDVRVVRLHSTDTLQGERCRTTDLNRPMDLSSSGTSNSPPSSTL